MVAMHFENQRVAVFHIDGEAPLVVKLGSTGNFFKDQFAKKVNAVFPGTVKMAGEGKTGEWVQLCLYEKRPIPIVEPDDKFVLVLAKARYHRMAGKLFVKLRDELPQQIKIVVHGYKEMARPS